MPENSGRNGDLIRKETRAISASTAVNVGLVVTLLVAAWGASGWAAKIEGELRIIQLEMHQLSEKIYDRMDDRWRRRDAGQLHYSYSQWVQSMQARNPDMEWVPFPEFPSMD